MRSMWTVFQTSTAGKEAEATRLDQDFLIVTEAEVFLVGVEWAFGKRVAVRAAILST
jgi:hypothetical protein